MASMHANFLKNIGLFILLTPLTFFIRFSFETEVFASLS